MRRRVIGTLAVAGLAAMIAASPAMAARSGGGFDLRLATQRLERLTGSRYEVWVIEGRKKLSAGLFDIGANGKQLRTRFSSPIDPATADTVAVTIEPVPDRSKGPSGIVVLAGKPGGARANLSFPVKLGKIGGSYVLASPTDGDSTNETAGVWFLDPAAGPGPSLSLPTLPSGWIWEGWAATQGKPLPTGRFSAVDRADRFSGYSGPNPGPPLPGEDFVRELPSGVTPPVDLADGNSLIVVSIEPDLKGKDPTGPGPFSIKPLVGKVPPGLAALKSAKLKRDLSTVPRGVARF